MHTARHQAQLIKRVRIINGQLNAVANAIEADRDNGTILGLAKIVRGALDSLLSEMLDEHLRFHVLPPADRSADGRRRADELIELVRRYLK